MRLAFRRKLFLSFSAFALCISGLLLLFVYWSLKGIPERLTRDLLMATVSNAAPLIDPADISILQDPANPKSHEAYIRLRDVLTAIDQNPPHFSKRLKTVRGYDKDVYLLVETSDPGVGKLLVTINPAEAGRLYNMTRFPAMMEGWQRLSADPHLSADEYGQSLAAYMPIKDKKGTTVAVLGIDAPAEAVNELNSTARVPF